MSPWPIAVFVAWFMLMFAALCLSLGIGIWYVILRGLWNTICDFRKYTWRIWAELPVALFWVVLIGGFGAAAAAAGYMLARDTIVGVIERFL